MSERGYLPPVNDDEKLVMRRVNDASQRVKAKGILRFLGFYSPREQELAQVQLRKEPSLSFCLNGGYPNAERAMLCIFEDDEQKPFPICRLFIKVAGKANNLTHRDYLGSLLGLGLARTCFGDILLGENGAHLFLQQQAVQYVRENLLQVGRSTATVLDNEDLILPQQDDLPQQSATVASLRLDAVLAAMLHLSRKEAIALLQKGLVRVNHREVDSASFTICEGDIFSIRGTGRFKLSALGGKSRKERQFIRYIQY